MRGHGAIHEHQRRRAFIDAITDVQRLMASPQRLQPYTTALINELRARGATAMMSAEIGASIDQQLAVPLPSAPTAMDNGILLRQVELRSELRWLVSVLKARQTATDPSIREFAIESNGLMVGKPFDATSDSDRCASGRRWRYGPVDASASLMEKGKQVSFGKRYRCRRMM